MFRDVADALTSDSEINVDGVPTASTNLRYIPEAPYHHYHPTVQTPTHTKPINEKREREAMSEQVQELAEHVQEFGKALRERLREALDKLPSVEEQLKKLRGLDKEK